MNQNSTPVVGAVIVANPVIPTEAIPANAVVVADSELVCATVINVEPVQANTIIPTSSVHNINSVVSASSSTPNQPVKSNVVEGIVIPPDPERGGEVADSYESMCIDAEVDVQMDLISVIRSMLLYRYISITMTIIFAVITIVFLILKNIDICVFACVMTFVNAICFFSSYKYNRCLMISFILLLLSILPPLLYFVYDLIIRVISQKNVDVAELSVVALYIVICTYQCVCSITIRRLLFYIPAPQRDLINFMERENRKEIKPKLVVNPY